MDLAEWDLMVHKIMRLIISHRSYKSYVPDKAAQHMAEARVLQNELGWDFFYKGTSTNGRNHNLNLKNLTMGPMMMDHYGFNG